MGNAIGKWIDLDPSPILILFPKAEAAKQYVAEKLEPMISATKRLRKKVDLRSRKLQQRQDFKRFPGGFLKMVGSNSPSSVKSTPVPRVAVEEPDDCNLNLRGQGTVSSWPRSASKRSGAPRSLSVARLPSRGSRRLTRSWSCRTSALAWCHAMAAVSLMR